MALDLIFAISQEICNAQLYLVIEMKDKHSSRNIYVSDLKTLAQSSAELGKLLIGAVCSVNGALPNSASASTLVCNRIRIPESQSLKFLKLLIQSGKLFWQGRSLFYNPLSKVDLSFEAEICEDDTLLLTGYVDIGSESFEFSSVDFLCMGRPIWGICKNVVFVLPDHIRPRLVRLVYPQASFLEGNLKKDILEEFEDEPLYKVKWIGATKAPSQTSSPIFLPVLPCLLLKDARGAFASLMMEYPNRSVEVSDFLSFDGRDVKAERSWEQDLLETDFVRKDMGNSQYYCPMDKIASSLSFLLELGWKVIDHKGRRLEKVTGRNLALESKQMSLSLKGTLRYGEHSVDVNQVLGAFNRREQFVELSHDSVGLLDHSFAYEGLEDLSEAHETTSEGGRLNKRQWGLLGSLLSSSDIKCPSSIQPLKSRIQEAVCDTRPLELPGFFGELYPYQKMGVEWLYFLWQNRMSGLLADEMGLGKTVQALALVSKILQQARKPILIVAPTSLLFNWTKEIEAYVKIQDVYLHSGPDRSCDLNTLIDSPLVLTSYALLRIDADLFREVHFSCIILDEAQGIKNPQSQLAQVAYSLHSEMRVCLTGTPVENRPEDLWSLFHFMEPDLLGGKDTFLTSVASASVDSRYQQRLQKTLRPFMLRRQKEEVAKDLPEKIEQIIWLEMGPSQRAIYEKWLKQTKAGLLKKVELEGAKARRMEIFEAILRLRQLCIHPGIVEGDSLESCKMERVLEDLEELISEGRKVLVYSQFVQVLSHLKKLIQSRGWRFSYLDGATKHRDREVKAFQEEEGTQIFLISLKAGGVGLNLTAADYVFILDPWWNEAVENQAIDRAHRFGRSSAVIARRYIVSQSIEEKMLTIKKRKDTLAKGLIDFDFENVTLSDMLELIK